MSIVKIFGIVVNTQNFDDQDKVITIYSDKYGKMGLLAKGVNKITSKNRFSIQLFAFSEFEIFKTNHVNKLSKLKTGYLIKNNFDISLNYNSYVYASSIIGIIYYNFSPGEKNKLLFEQTVLSIEKLADRYYSIYVYCWWLHKCLFNFGINLDLSFCQNCGFKKNQFRKFDFKTNGLLCINCVDNYTNIDLDFVALILSLQNNKHLDQDINFLIDNILKLLLFLFNFIDANVGLKIVGKKEILKQSIFYDLINENDHKK
ncbi:DNA repair protein RecO [Spiroplasma endosymbiont of Labia minor]|uniref:DNA repair protein RecO n=1 Tax=Spiroplasma endosymbiont of Labia minor TaxID=3066305 RepID=UPI0030D50710